MTSAQIGAVDFLTMLEFTEVHHGDCLGADHDMHRIARANGQHIVGHPPSDNRLRAYCDFDEEREPKPYHDRNRDIVDETDELVATPAEDCEQEKGGTWYTVRYARSQGKAVTIVWPDGTVQPENATSGANDDAPKRRLGAKSTE